MVALKSPAGSVVEAEGDLVKRLVSQGWADLTEKPKPEPVKKTERPAKGK